MANISFTDLLSSQKVVNALSKHENVADKFEAGFVKAALYDRVNSVPDASQRAGILANAQVLQNTQISGITRNTTLAATNTVACTVTGPNAPTVTQDVEYKDWVVSFEMESRASYDNNTIDYDTQFAINMKLAANELVRANNEYISTKMQAMKAIDAQIPAASGALTYTVANDAAQFTRDEAYSCMNQIHQIYQGAGYFGTVQEGVNLVTPYDYTPYMNQGQSDGSLKTRGTEIAPSNEAWVQQLNRYRSFFDYRELNSGTVGISSELMSFLDASIYIDYTINPAFMRGTSTIAGTEILDLQEVTVPAMLENGFGDIKLGIQHLSKCDTYTANGATNLTVKDVYAISTRSVWTEAFHTVVARMPSVLQLNVTTV